MSIKKNEIVSQLNVASFICFVTISRVDNKLIFGELCIEKCIEEMQNHIQNTSLVIDHPSYISNYM